MKRAVQFLIVGALLGTVGCQTMGGPVGETGVDEELTKPAPSTLPPGTTPDEPRPGFEQEPKVETQ